MEDGREGEHRNLILSSSLSQDAMFVGGIHSLTSRRHQKMGEERLLDTVAHGERPKARTQRLGGLKKAAVLSILLAAPTAMAQNCVSLSGSKACPAFSAASVSTSSATVGLLYVLSL